MTTHRRLLRLAGPLILANLSAPLLGAADTAVMGHLPESHYLGAVAIGAVLFNFIYWGFGFLRMGTTGFAAQAHGAGDADELRAVLARALILGAVIALLLLALQWPLAVGAFALFDASAEVEQLGRIYFDIRIWAAPAALANYALLGCFLGMQNARAALVLQVAMNGLNIALDFLFVFGFGWGIEGVALATLLAEYGGAALGAVLMVRLLRPVGGRYRPALILRRDALLRTLAVNRDIFLRTVTLIFAFAYFTNQGARMGDTVLAANAVLMNFQSFMAFGLDAFAHAAEALVGDAVGARNRAALRRAARAACIWAVAVSLLYSLGYLLFGGQIIAALTGIAEIRSTAMAYLPWVIATPVISVWSFLLDGIFIGATGARVMRNAMILSVAIYLAACATLIPLWGNHGLWLAFLIFMAARGVTLAVRYPALERGIAGPIERFPFTRNRFQPTPPPGHP